MKQLTQSLTLFIISLCAQAQPLSQELDRLIQSYVPMAQVGYTIMEAPTGRILAEYQSQKNFAPASNTKLLSAYAAFKALGPKFQYTTQLFQEEQDWVMVFTGDPSLTTEDVADLLAQIKKQGIQTLKGNLLVDDTLYSNDPYASGLMFEDLSWAYSAPVTTLTLDENAIPFKLTPGKAIGEKASIQISNSDRYPAITFKSDIVSVTDDKAQHHCHLTVNIDSLNYQFGGCWPVSESEVTLKAAIQDPKARFEALIPQLLNKAGIDFKGKVIFKKSNTKDLKILAEHRSAPLRELLKPILADSNNHYANAILKTLGYQTLGEGTFKGGVLATKTFLKPTGIDTKLIQIEDGAGTSYYNLASPNVFARLLHHIYDDTNTKLAFMDSLAIAGQSGTLKSKFQAQSITGRVRAKTGSMTGVSNLSGYLRTQAETDIIFSFMLNGAIVDKGVLNQLLTEFCYLLVFHPETNRKT
ncbi:MAG: D-alanyl-D-alanine carboxypeptidase/D-alanyl-D-alanine-endopeptidase [Gammaproteobacteria bacterium]